MKTRLIFICILFLIPAIHAQVGINTTNPQGMLDVNSSTMGIILPRVTSIEDVTNADGSTPPINGTVVYDVQRDKICQRINNSWVCTGVDNSGVSVTEVERPTESTNSTYFKASNTGTGDFFGYRVSASDDGTRFAVASLGEDSGTTGINGNQADNTANGSGAVYVFALSGGVWMQEAYIKASNTESNDQFGEGLSMSGDGNYLAIGAPGESSGATGINGNQSDNSAALSGATYIFIRSGATWSQEAYLKASTNNTSDRFGYSVALSDDGSRLLAGAIGEASNATGVNGNESDNSLSNAGAAFVFSRSGSNWSQEAYLKASDTGANDQFGANLSISGDGMRVAICAASEDSNATGINGDDTNNSFSGSGAVYVFVATGIIWSQEAYIKASNTDANDNFGASISLTNDGSRLAVGATSEDSNATGVNGDDSNNFRSATGAAYVFSRSGTTWSQEAYIKVLVNDATDQFGIDIAISGDGTRLVACAISGLLKLLFITFLRFSSNNLISRYCIYS
jgi:hypothetical protein